MSKVLVLGLGLSGRAAAALLLEKGFTVVGVDSNLHLLETHAEIAELCKKGLKTCHESEVTDLTTFDSILVSPGVSQEHPIYQKAKKDKKKIVGEVELAFHYLEGKAFLGVTGTNGKTTVTYLITHVLNASGIPAKALGNVGIPLTSYCKEAKKDEIYVIELSSFQLETLNEQVLDAAVLLNITPDHLDRYPSLNAYAEAKIHIGQCVKPTGCFYVEESCVQQYHFLFQEINKASLRLYGYSSACDLSTDLRHLLVGNKIECTLPLHFQGERSHDLENLMAAYAICKTVGITSQQFVEALATFKKPPHRIEYVKTLQGVAYYDDSKGTNIDAVVRAVEQMKGNVILIAGGVDKGSPYTPWVASFKGKVKAICAIGQAATKIQKDLAGKIPVYCFVDLEQAVTYASKIASSGETVLLSPGCSSFDMFRDYAHRGETFQRIVNSL